jgi:hypothetical protein
MRGRLVTIVEAARELGVDARTVCRDIAGGLVPILRKGRRGRGCPTLIDLEAYRARREKTAVGAECALRAFAAEVPELLAEAMELAFREVCGPHKRAIAGELAGAWYRCTTALLDRLRRDVPTLPELDTVPESISKMRHI